MIKKLVLWFVSGVSVLLGFSSAWYVEQVWQFYPSQYNNQYNIQVINKWSFLTQFLWTTKDVFLMDSQNFFIWDDVGNIYVHRDTYTPSYWHSYHEWFVDYYFSCDVLTWWSSSPANCTASSVDSSTPELYSNFLKTVNSSDYYYYNLRNIWCYSSICASQIMLCVSSSSLDKSLCWAWWFWWPGASCPDLWWVCPSYSNSQWFWEINFWSLNWYPSPAVDWSIDWSSSVSDNVLLSWNVLFSSCSNWYIIKEVESISPELFYWCYAWSFNTWSLENWQNYIWFVNTWLTLRELYQLTKNWWSFSDWFNSNLDQINRYKLWQVGVNPFIWSPVALYTYFDILWSKWINSYYKDDLVNYCNLKLYSDYNSEYQWSHFSYLCKKLSVNDTDSNYDDVSVDYGDYDDDLNDVSNNISSWVVIWVDRSGTLSWDSNKNFDWKTFINNVYQKLQENYKKPFRNAVWIIPSYILIALCGLLLFRFLSH